MTWTEKRRVAIPDGELALVEAGDPEAPPVVLLSGGFTSSYLWRGLIPLLAPWMRVIAPDLLGLGRLGFAGRRRPPSAGPGRQRQVPAGGARHRTLRGGRPRSGWRRRAAPRDRGRGGGARAHRLDRVRRVALASDPRAPVARGRRGRRLRPLVVRHVLRRRDGAPRTPLGRRPRRVPTPVRERRRSAALRPDRRGLRRRGTGRAGTPARPSSRSRRSSCGGRTTRSCRPSSPNAWATRCPGRRWRSCPAAATSCSRTPPRPSRR